ncbi:MAG: nucleotidyltransferase family protein [Candidatus Woesearchaeota archaeon]
MIAIILAAGYGVRLERDLRALRDSDRETHNRIADNIRGRPKPMVLIDGKPLIEYLVEDIEKINDVERIIIVTNNKYFRQIEEWTLSYNSSKEIKILNDGTNFNADRLGAVGDLLFALGREEVDDDVLLLAGDNLFTFGLREMVEFFREKQSDVLLTYPERDKERVKRSACMKLDDEWRVTYFEEKPENPVSDLICPAVYVFRKDTVKLIKSMDFGIDMKDLIGNIPLMIYKNKQVYALKKEDKARFDLGTVQDYLNAEDYVRRMSEGEGKKIADDN